MKYFVSLLAVVALVGAGTKLAYDRYDDEISTHTSTGAGERALTLKLPSQNQVVVTGSLSVLDVKGAVLGALGLPLTINAERSGVTAASIEGVVINGSGSSIQWDAGRPLNLSGAGSFTPITAGLTLSKGSLQVAFSGTSGRLSKGSYRIDTPVAVGKGGLATAVDQVSFTSDGNATIAFSRTAATTLPRTARKVTGPGSVHLEGDLTLIKPDGSRTHISRAELPSGPFELLLTPEGRGYRVEVTLQGKVSSS